MKKFPTRVVLSLTTSQLMCEFFEFQRLIEHIAGHPVFIHELADKLFLDCIREDVLDQHPVLREITSADINESNWQGLLSCWVQKFGRMLEIKSSSLVRDESPEESLQRLAPGVIAVLAKRNVF